MVNKGSKTQISIYYMILFIGILHFLHFADIEFFYNLNICSNHMWSKSPNSISSLCISVSHFGNSCNISNFFIIFIKVTHFQWFFFSFFFFFDQLFLLCYYHNSMKIQMTAIFSKFFFHYYSQFINFVLLIVSSVQQNESVIHISTL